MNSSRWVAVLGAAVLELVGHAGAVEQGLGPDHVAGLLGSHPSLGGGQGLLDDLVGLSGVLLEPLAQLVVGGLLHERLDAGVAELALGLTLELRVAQAHRDDRGDALPDVVAGEVRVLLLEGALGPSVLVDHRGEGGLEALLVGPALGGVDAVGEAVDAIGVVAGVPLEGDLHLVVLLGQLVVADLAEERLLAGVEVLDEVDDPAGVAVGDRLGAVVGALVLEADLEALVEEGHHLQPLEDGAGGELGGLEDGGVGPERHGGAGAATGGVAHHLELAGGLAAVGEGHLVVLAVAVDLDDEPRGEGVDDRDADAVEAARHLVALAAELAATVELGEGDLDAGHLLLLVDVGGDAAPVVDHPAAAVGQQGDVDPGGVAGHGLVDRVVDHLPHAVVQAGGPGAADVHAGALADRVETLQDLHVVGPVGPVRLRHEATSFSWWARRLRRPS